MTRERTIVIDLDTLTADDADVLLRLIDERERRVGTDAARPVIVDVDTVTSAHLEELLILVREREARQEARVAHANELLTQPTLGAYRRHEVEGIEL